jgi:hypothetical protein
MPNIEHITISSPDQNMSPRYRKSTADYTLISLRIAIERAPLEALTNLSLRAIHPTALLCLQPKLSYGSTPNSCRRWTQIQNLSLELDTTSLSYPRFDENLSVIQSYLRAFATSLTHLSFRWSGRGKGPSPISPDPNSIAWQTGLNPLPTPSKGDTQRPVSPRSIRFFKLQYLVLENAIMDSEQVASFITNHRQTLIEFSFEDVSLRNGDWQSTLEPLRKLRRSERSRPRLQPLAYHPGTYASEEMDVPCKLSPVDLPGDEPLIMDTLEPQDDEPAPWIGRPKHSGMRRWFDRGNKPPQQRHQRKVSDHLRRVFNGNIFSWR